MESSALRRRTRGQAVEPAVPPLIKRSALWHVLGARTRDGMPLSAEKKRTRRVLARYAQNAAGSYVRVSAFRECDYRDDGSPREFPTEAEVLAFEAARYSDGTGNRVKFWSAPRASVPEGQRALHDNLAQAVQAEGNAVCAQLEAAEEGLHERLDEMGARLERLLEYHEREPPPVPPDDLQLMAQLSHKRVPVHSMDALLADHTGARPPRNLTKGEKAALIVEQLPRDKVSRFLVDANEPGRQRAGKRVKPAQPHAQTTLLSLCKAARGNGADTGADSTVSTSADTGAPGSPSSALSLPAETSTEASLSDEGLVWL